MAGPGLEDSREDTGVETRELSEEVDMGLPMIRSRFRIGKFA